MASLEAAKHHGVARASWMQRQSEILGRWKLSFFVLYRNGNFAYYKDENMREEQGTINVVSSCYAVNVGMEIKGTTPPPDKGVHCLLELRTHQINMILCTDSIDDSQAWKSAIIEVKNSNTAPARPPAYAQPPTVAPPAYFAQPPVVAVAPPPYTVTQVAPPAQQFYVNPGGATTTYTSYQVPSNQYVIPPANQTVILSGRGYPVQNTVYAYRGQSCMYTSRPTTTIVYRR